MVSDHGMTENGNHGGSSYEETDSLLLFIGSKSHATDSASVISNDVNQVFSSYTPSFFKLVLRLCIQIFMY